jgi:hypothetical protein
MWVYFGVMCEAGDSSWQGLKARSGPMRRSSAHLASGLFIFIGSPERSGPGCAIFGKEKYGRQDMHVRIRRVKPQTSRRHFRCETSPKSLLTNTTTSTALSFVEFGSSPRLVELWDTRGPVLKTIHA